MSNPSVDGYRPLSKYHFNLFHKRTQFLAMSAFCMIAVGTVILLCAFIYETDISLLGYRSIVLSALLLLLSGMCLSIWVVTRLLDHSLDPLTGSEMIGLRLMVQKSSCEQLKSSFFEWTTSSVTLRKRDYAFVRRIAGKRSDDC